jgi:hypothetical protein
LKFLPNDEPFVNKNTQSDLGTLIFKIWQDPQPESGFIFCLSSSPQFALSSGINIRIDISPRWLGAAGATLLLVDADFKISAFHDCSHTTRDLPVLF